MVISCPECSTRFRVDENKIPAQGAKIRCARCKHVFAVTPPAPEPAVLNEEPLQEEPSPAMESAPEPPAPPEDPVTETAPAESEETTPADDDFGFDDFDSSEIGAGANDELDPSSFDEDASVSEDDAFSFGDDYGNVSLGDDEESDVEADEDAFSFGDPAPSQQPAASTAESDQEEFSFTPAKNPADELKDPLADSFREDPALEDMSMPPSDDGFFGDEPDLKAVPAQKSSSRSPLSVVILFILVLTLAILIAGGILVWKGGPGGLEKLISNLTGQPIVTEVNGDIRLLNLQGSFITNRKEGEIFVIRGLAVNDYPEAQAAIQVKGIIFDKDGKQLLQKTIFCGNPISDNDLRKLPYSKMEEMMGNQFGESLANLNVTPGQSIPFTIVFRKLPKTLSEFVVEVADSKPAAQ